MTKLFGTNGARGVTNKELTTELALGLGKAIGTYFKEGAKILIARDARSGGDMIMRACQAGLLSTGVEVHYAGLLPTPGLQYNLKHGDYDGGVMITASHNPAEFNGIKVVDADGVETAKVNEEKIEEFYFSGKFRTVEWQKLTKDVIVEEGMLEKYVDGVLKDVDVKKIAAKKFKVLVDGGSSVGSLSSVLVAKKLGCEVHETNTKLDPLFRERPPEPTPTSLAKTAEIVKKTKVDLAVAHDGDADRAIFVDSQGRVQLGDRSGTLLSYWASKKEKGMKKIVYTPFSSSNLVDEFLGKHGIEVKWTRIGSIVVSRSLIDHGGLAGFEDNGGFFYPKHMFVRDGAMTFALMLEMMAEEGKTSAELFDMLPHYETEKIKVPLTKSMDVNKIFGNVEKAYKGKANVVDTDHDGLKLVGTDFWFIIRKSGTEPVVRISVEAKSPEKLKEVLEHLKSMAV